MKNLILIATFLISCITFAQGSLNETANELEVIELNEKITTHILSKVHVSKVDVSTDFVAVQISNANIIALKPKNADNMELGVISIIGQDYFKQYRLVYTNNIDNADSQIKITSNDDNYFLNPSYEMTNIDMWKYSQKISELKPTYYNNMARSNKAIIKLNNIIVKDHLIFIDFSIKNKTNLMYDVNDIEYTVDDKKVVKNTNVQRVIVEPKYVYNKEKTFRKKYRNIVVFDKMTFPDNKEFIIELSEKQISGRTIKLSISYLDILNADTL